MSQSPARDKNTSEEQKVQIYLLRLGDHNALYKVKSDNFGHQVNSENDFFASYFNYWN